MGRLGRSVAASTALLVALGLVAVILAQGMSASGYTPGSRAPTPQTHSFPSSQVLQYVSGPFISEGSAETIALRMGQGAGGTTQVVGAKLESVAAATAVLGSRPAALDIASARMVWVVELKGTYVQSSCSPSGNCLAPLSNQTYYVVIDAATGNTLATGIFNLPVGH